MSAYLPLPLILSSTKVNSCCVPGKSTVRRTCSSLNLLRGVSSFKTIPTSTVGSLDNVDCKLTVNPKREKQMLRIN